MRVTKWLITTLVLLSLNTTVFSQQLSLGNTPYMLNKSAVLELNSDKQGLLFPRINDTSVINALTPPDGMVIYFVPDKQLFLRSNSAWKAMSFAASLSNYWSIDGNTNGGLKNIGTTDNYALPFITNNTERMRLSATGLLGIGTTSPSTLLHVSGTNPLTLEGVQTGTATSTDSLLTITSGLVKKLPVSIFQSQLNGTGFVKASGTTISYDNNAYTVANTAITGATKTKITYDSKGLVTSGADATTSDIAEGSNLYYTDARVRSAALTGLSTATTTAVTATDNILAGVGKLQGQINNINSAGYLTGNQTITLSGDVSGSGTTAITTTIGANKVTLGQMAQVANGTFLGRISASTGNVEALTTAQAKTMLGLTGTNSGDVALAGQNYLSLSGQTITANAIDLSGTNATGTLAAARFGALTGDVTNTAGSYATTIANGAVTYAKMQNISATNRLLGRASAGAGTAEEITIGSGLTLTGTTLSATGTGSWSTIGNAGTTWNNNFIGTTDNNGFRIRTNDVQRFLIDSLGRVGVGVTDPNNPMVVKDTLEIRRTGTMSSLLFSNTSGAGDFRIGGDGGDLFWQGGGGRSLQMGSYWGMVLGGDRQTSAFPGFVNGSGGTGVLVQSQRAASVPLAIQGAASQSGNLTEWRNSASTVLNVVNSSGNLGIGTTAPSTKLHVVGTNPLTLEGVQLGTNTSADSVLTISSGLVKKLPASTFTAASNLWSTAGNSGTTWNNHFIGTTDNNGFRVRTNNTERIVVDSLGSVGIGSGDFESDLTAREKLLVDAGSTSSYNLIVGRGDINNYLQLNIQNTNNGNFASSDVVATANNGSEGSVYIDMGINSQGYSSGNSSILNGSNTAYLYATGNNFYIGNGAQNKDLIFFTNTGSTGADGTERMRIASTKVTVRNPLLPEYNNSYTLGNSSYRWSTIYSVNALNTSSDARLKTNITGLNYGLKEVLALRPVSYNWKSTPDVDKKLGLIAQEVRKLIPEIVHGDELKDTLSMSYQDLVPVLINAIKEQQKQIEDLKQQQEKDKTSLKELDELKQQMKALTDRMNKVEKK